MSENGKLPRYARTVLVPVARPDTALAMLELATTLIHPENGRIIALTVASTEGSEATSEMVESLEPIIQQLTTVGHPIEMVTQIASSVTRGILEGVREHNADLLIVGVHMPDRRQVQLGSVVENLMEAATCDLLVYRLGTRTEYDRVLVPLDGTSLSINALKVGATLAKARRAKLLPLYIQRDYVHRAEHETAMQEIYDVLEPGQVQKDVITGKSPAERIVRELDAEDLLVLGFSQTSDFERQIENDLTNVLLNRAPCPVLLTSRLEYRSNLLGNFQRRLQQFNPWLTQAERNELVWQAQKMALANIDFWTMIILSALLASLGLLLNSAAVIIGAMLVAPLLQPLGGLSIGLVTGMLPVTQRGLLSLVQGVVLALLVSILTGVLLPIDNPTVEMLARGNPTLLDAGVAIVSGWVAAYAIARKDIPAALAGVAIAAALMPPICTIGLSIAMQDAGLALGSSLLFLTNILFIIVAQYSIFLWIGMRPGRRQTTAAWTRLWWTAIAALSLLVFVLLYTLSIRAGETLRIQQYLLRQFPDTEVSDLQVNYQDEEINVSMTLRSTYNITNADVREVETQLADYLRRPGDQVTLQIAQLRMLTAESDTHRQVLDYIEVNYPEMQIVDTRVSEGANRIIIGAIMRGHEWTPEDVQQTQDALSVLFQKPVEMWVSVQSVVTANGINGSIPTPSESEE